MDTGGILPLSTIWIRDCDGLERPLQNAQQACHVSFGVVHGKLCTASRQDCLFHSTEGCKAGTCTVPAVESTAFPISIPKDQIHQSKYPTFPGSKSKMAFRLWTSPLSYNSLRPALVLAEKGVTDYEIVEADLMGGKHKVTLPDRLIPKPEILGLVRENFSDHTRMSRPRNSSTKPSLGGCRCSRIRTGL